MGDVVDKATMLRGDVKLGKELRTVENFGEVIFGKSIVAIEK